MLATLLALAVSLPAVSQDPARERLEASPRHHEWVQLERGERKLSCFVAFPEVAEKVPAVLVIHENKGLTDWVRSVADRLAEEGYIAIAPDLLSGMGPEGGRTDSFVSTDAATQALYALDPAQVLADLDAAADHATQLAACDGTLFVAGFCWGGSRSFQYATHRKGLKAAFVFYGSAPTDEEALARVASPVHGFYAENDARVNASLEATVEVMARLEKTFTKQVFAGAGHGFMRAGEGPDAKPENARARTDAWKRWLELLESDL